MREATSYLIGRHDFASFCGTGAQVKSTVRTITGIDVWRDGDIVTIRVKGVGISLTYGSHHCRNTDSGRKRAVSAGTCEKDPRCLRPFCIRTDRAGTRTDTDRN